LDDLLKQVNSLWRADLGRWSTGNPVFYPRFDATLLQQTEAYIAWLRTLPAVPFATAEHATRLLFVAKFMAAWEERIHQRMQVRACAAWCLLLAGRALC
jgi:hypothetical protein